MNGNDNLEILDEKAKSKDADVVVSYCAARAELFYQHTLKYKHNPTKQSTTWVDDINRYADEMINKSSFISERQFNAEVEKQGISMQELYKNGMRAAYNEDARNNNVLNKYDVFDEFPTFKDIMDKNKIKNFLKKNAYTHEVKDYLNTENGYTSWSVYSIIKKKK